MQITNAIELVIKAKAETESSAFLTPWGIRDLERRCRNAEKLLDECRSIMAAFVAGALSTLARAWREDQDEGLCEGAAK